MQLKKESIWIELEGKLITDEDIIQAFNFGMTKEGIIKNIKKIIKKKI